MIKSLYIYFLLSIFSFSSIHSMEKETKDYLKAKRVAFTDASEPLLPFHQSIVENDIEAIKQRFAEEIKTGSDFSFLETKSCGANALAFACADKNGKIAKLILKHKPDLAYRLCVNSPGIFLYPLQVTAMHGNAKIARLLLDLGVDVHEAESNSLTPLDYAIRHNSKTPASEFLTLLIQHGAQMPYKQELKEQWNAYETANIYSCSDIKEQQRVKELLMPLKDPSTGENFLHMAVKCKNLDDIKHFCEKFPERKDELANNYGVNPFHQACLTHNIPMLELLLKQGCNINNQTNTGFTPLHLCSYTKNENSTRILQWLIDNKADLEIKENRGYTPFLIAVAYGNIEAMDALYKAEANIGAINREGNTALHAAAVNDANPKEIIEWLLAKNAIDINAHNTNQTTPFLMAAGQNNIEILSALKDAGADVHITDQFGNSALHESCFDNTKIDSLCWLLKNCDIPMDSKNHHGASPLLIAALNGNVKALQLLHQTGADITTCNEAKETALHKLIQFINKNSHSSDAILAIEWLLDVCPDLLEKITKYEETALWIAAFYRNLEVLKILYKHGANVYVENADRETILHCLAQSQDDYKPELLDWCLSLPNLDMHKLLNAQTTYGVTPYMVAAHTANHHALEALHKAGADISLKTSDGKTALWVACKKNNIEAARIIIQHGADINTIDAHQTPLIIKMVEDNNLSAVKLLCEHGINLSLTNAAGQNALEVAQQHGNADMIEFFKSPFEFKDKDGCTPFLQAVMQGNIAAMETLYKVGANIAAITNGGNLTALHLVSLNKKNPKEVLAWLLGKNAIDINALDITTGNSPFLTATLLNNCDVLSVLKSAGAAIEAVNSNKRGALHLASLHPKQLESLRWLLENCTISIESRDEAGNTPLHIAASLNNIQAIELLHSHNADLKSYDNEKNTALHAAVRKSSIDAMQYLLKQCPELLEQPNDFGMTAFLITCSQYNLESLKILFQYGANIYAKNNLQQSALHYLVRNKNPESFDWFLSLPNLNIQTLVNSQSSDGTTPYMIAAYNANHHALEALYKAGANVSLKTINGLTALWAACKAKHIDTARLIIQHGADINVINEHQTPLIIKMVEDNNLAAVKLLCEHNVNLTATNAAGQNALEVAQQLGNADMIAFLKQLLGTAKTKLLF